MVLERRKIYNVIIVKKQKEKNVMANKDISELIVTQTEPGERAVVQMDKLGDLLDENGGLVNHESTINFIDQMRQACKLPCQFIFLYIIEATCEKQDILMAFMKNGGWTVICTWLQDAKIKENQELINSLLCVCKILPVNVKDMKENNCAKLIKTISKNSETHFIKKIATDIVLKWKKLVKNESEKRKEKNKHKIDKRPSSNLKRQRSNSKESLVSISENKTDDNVVNNDSKNLNRLKTPKLKLRVTGLEEETKLVMKKRSKVNNGSLVTPKLSTTLPPSKRASALSKDTEPLDKKAKKETSPNNVSKTKLITNPPMPAQESSMFMNALITASSKSERKKKKTKKLNISQKQDKLDINGLSPSHSMSSPNSTSPQYSPDLSPQTANHLMEIENQPNSPEIESNLKLSTKTLLTEGGNLDINHGNKKKRVSWATESDLKTFHYFELDENERVNVNRLKDFEEVKREEMLREKQTMLAKKAAGIESSFDDTFMVTYFWTPPAEINSQNLSTVIRGSKSSEINVQKQREETCLVALYFSRQAIPLSPHEPDISECESDIISTPINIPLVSTTEMKFEHNAYNRANDAAMLLPGSGGQLQLNPEVSNLLASMASKVETNGLSNDLLSADNSKKPQLQSARDAISKLPLHLRSLLEQPNIQNLIVQTVGDNPSRIMALLNEPSKLQNIIGNFQMRQMQPPPNNNFRGGHHFNSTRSIRPDNRLVCKHFYKGTCKYGSNCNFLHPGVNGPRI